MSDNYWADVSYNLWRSGRNPDIDRDAVSDYKADGYSAEETARAIIRDEQRREERRREAALYEEAYWEHQYEQEQEPEPEPPAPEQPEE